MSRRFPIIPTILVALAVAAMIALGVWQLQRATWKQSLIERYATAPGLPPIAWPSVWPKSDSLPLFRRATGVCQRVVGTRSSVGESRSGEPGYVRIVDCRTGAEGPGMSVEVGWSKNPNAKANWRAGAVSGIIVPDRRTLMRLVADMPAPGLEASNPPSVETISRITPAGHRAYALTWFAFAAIALVIYGLALRKRMREGSK